MRVNVTTAASSYPVVIAPGALGLLGDLVADAAQVAVLHPASLTEVAQRVAASVSQAGPRVHLIAVPEAEDAKTPRTLIDCWDALAGHQFTRSDLVIGLGGGTTTDLAGFVAASWLRGVGHILCPTTVLGMVDAAVGGKTGINLSAGKNLVGAFHEPRAVLCDLDLLTGLPAAEVSSGLAEVAKCGFIRDPGIVDLIGQDPAEARDVTSVRFGELVRRAVQVKADVVADDLTEATSTPGRVGREALNYGHTLGHAIEAHEQFRMRHGEAISIGMSWMAEVSQRLLGLDAGTVALHRDLLGSLGLPTTYGGADWARLRALMSIDKKSRGQTLRLIGLAGLGKVEVLAGPDEGVLASAFDTIDSGGVSITRLH